MDESKEEPKEEPKVETPPVEAEATASMPAAPPLAPTPGGTARTPREHWMLIALVVVSVIAVLLLASTMALAIGGFCHEGGRHGECGWGEGRSKGENLGQQFNGQRRFKEWQELNQPQVTPPNMQSVPVPQPPQPPPAPGK